MGLVPSCHPHSLGYTRTSVRPHFPSPNNCEQWIARSMGEANILREPRGGLCSSDAGHPELSKLKYLELTSLKFNLRSAISAATYRGAKCPTLKTARKGCRAGPGQTAEKTAEKNIRNTPKTAVLTVFRLFFRLFDRDPLGTLSGLFSKSGIWHLPLNSQHSCFLGCFGCFSGCFSAL